MTAPPPAASPETEEDLRATAERRFGSGLASKDLVERDWAFRYAAAYRRAEALPVLVQELKNDGRMMVSTALAWISAPAIFRPIEGGVQ